MSDRVVVIRERGPAQVVTMTGAEVVAHDVTNRTVLTAPPPSRSVVSAPGERVTVTAVAGARATIIDAVMVKATAAGALSGHRVVYPDPVTGLVTYADNRDLALLHAPLWLTVGAMDAGAEALVLAEGRLVEPTWSWGPGGIFLGQNGALTQTLALDAAFARQVALPAAVDALYFDPQPPIALSL